MDMLLVPNVLLVDHIDLHPLLIVLPFQDVSESLLKVLAVAVKVFTSVFTKQEQLPLVGLQENNICG